MKRPAILYPLAAAYWLSRRRAPARGVAVAACALLSGCASMGPAEIGWQTLHAVDTYQTMQIAQHPGCYREADPLTRPLIGEHPSEAEVAAVMVAYSIGHFYVSRWLDDRTDSAFEQESPNRGAWYVARAVWTVGGLLAKGAVVAHNNSIGLGPFNREDCP
jgi:hypothetical protein